MKTIHRAALGAIFPVYLALLAFRRDTVPEGLCNDTAEEALRGMILLAQHRLEPITDILGNSAETLYLYALGFSARVLGPTTLAVQIVSWLCALGIIALTIAVARKLDASVPPMIPAALAATSIWLFHYGRAGLRAISAPLFLLLFILFMLDAERRARDAFLAGAVLGLGLYAYTAFRVVPIAWLVWAIWRIARGTDRRAEIRRAAIVAGTALLVSLPNLLFLVRDPRAFLLRGAYVMRGGKLGNVIATTAMPLLYFDEYRNINGPHHFFDGVSAGLTHANINPVHPLIALLFLAGLVSALRRDALRRRSSLLLLCGAAAAVIIGIAGPSLTRMLIVLPVVLIVASEGAALLPRWLFAAVVAVVVATHGYAYFVRFPRDPAEPYHFSAWATPIGQRAAELRRGGANVLCVVSGGESIIRYLTGNERSGVEVVEFYNRPFEAREIPPLHGVALIERAPRFDGVERMLEARERRIQPRYIEIVTP